SVVLPDMTSCPWNALGRPHPYVVVGGPSGPQTPVPYAFAIPSYVSVETPSLIMAHTPGPRIPLSGAPAWPQFSNGCCGMVAVLGSSTSRSASLNWLAAVTLFVRFVLRNIENFS